MNWLFTRSPPHMCGWSAGLAGWLCINAQSTVLIIENPFFHYYCMCPSIYIAIHYVFVSIERKRRGDYECLKLIEFRMMMCANWIFSCCIFVLLIYNLIYRRPLTLYINVSVCCIVSGGSDSNKGKSKKWRKILQFPHISQCIHLKDKIGKLNVFICPSLHIPGPRLSEKAIFMKWYQL